MQNSKVWTKNFEIKNFGGSKKNPIKCVAFFVPQGTFPFILPLKIGFFGLCTTLTISITSCHLNCLGQMIAFLKAGGLIMQNLKSLTQNIALRMIAKPNKKIIFSKKAKIPAKWVIFEAFLKIVSLRKLVITFFLMNHFGRMNQQ